MTPAQVKLSKTLSYWLRHRPDAGQLALTAEGWAEVDAVLAAMAREGLACDWEALLAVVEGNDKQRFELSADADRIRARQGHSIAVDLDWPLATPPAVLFHGTVARFLDAILAEGLKPMRRHHVHLSPDEATARRVGSRRGEAVILRVAAGEMQAAGRVFRLSSNGVWLTDHVPPGYLSASK